MTSIEYEGQLEVFAEYKVTERLKIETEMNSSLEAVLEDNQMFINFYDFMNGKNASHLLQFYMNADSFKQFCFLAAKEEKMDDDRQVSLLRDAVEIFNNYFSINAKRKVAISSEIIMQIKAKIEKKKMDATLFDDAQKAVYLQIEKDYFPLFSEELKIKPPLSHQRSASVENSSPFAEGMPLSKSLSEPNLLEDSDTIQKQVSEEERKIITRITSLKEQIFIINEKLDETEAAGGKRRNSLMEERRKLEKELKSLNQLLYEDSSHFDFAQASVSVQFARKESFLSLSNNPSLLIKLQFSSFFIPSLLIKKKWNECAKLHQELIKSFPKVSKISFPSMLFFQDSNRIAGLENYFNVLLADEMICKSKLISGFFLADDAKSVASTNTTGTSLNELEGARMEAPSDDLIAFSDEEVDLLLDGFFAVLLETFDLNENSQWIRRKLLNIAKNLVKQAYNQSINKTLAEKISAASSEEFIAKLIVKLAESVLPPIKIQRDENQKLATMIEAKSLLLSNTPDMINRIVGHYNVVTGVNRIFSMLQEREFNKRLLFVVFDILIKLLFSNKKE